MGVDEAMAADHDRTLGAVEARVESHDERLRRIEAKLDHVVSVVDQSRGGMRVLAAVATLGGAVGATLMKLLGLKIGQ